MNYILFDDKHWHHLLPLTFTRPISELRLGIITIKEKWEKYLSSPISYLTEVHLREKYPLYHTTDNIVINACLLPDSELVKAIGSLKPGEMLCYKDTILAARINKEQTESYQENKEFGQLKANLYSSPFEAIKNPWDLFSKNDKAIRDDFALLTKNRQSMPISSSNKCIHPENIFLEKGASVECAILNASTGPIYIGTDAEVMEGAIIRGPFAIGEHSTIKMGAKIYGATTLGPHCKVGGEVQNSIFIGFSNKAHDGYLGNAVLGEWCNLGADTNNSNLKNNYAEVKVWSYVTENFAKTGLQFCGLIMGDHSKSAINTMFNTGTVVGVCANIFGAGFPRNFIPSFSWGGPGNIKEYPLKSANEVIEKVMARRSLPFDEVEQRLIQHVFELTAKYRNF